MARCSLVPRLNRRQFRLLGASLHHRHRTCQKILLQPVAGAAVILVERGGHGLLLSTLLQWRFYVACRVVLQAASDNHVIVTALLL